MVAGLQLDPQELQPRLDAQLRLRSQLRLEPSEQLDKHRILRRPSDEAAVFIGDDPRLVGLAEPRERARGPRGIGVGEPGAQRLQLNDLGIAELPRKERRAILAKKKDRGRLADQRDQQKQQDEPSEQRPRPERQVPTLSPAASGLGASSGTNT